MMILLPWWAIAGTFLVGLFLFWRLYQSLLQKNEELAQKNFRMQLLSDQERQDVLRISKLEYDLSKLQQEKEHFLVLQQKFEHDRTHFFKEILEKSAQLDMARERFEEEKNRLIETQKKEQEFQFENKQRMWNDHENSILALLKTLVARPESFFVSFDNTHLPPLWNNALKPDFLLQYMDSYIVFDAKKSKNIKSYLDTQIKSTVEKYSEVPEISKMVFFIFPEEDLLSLEKKVYTEKGYTFFIISSALLSVLLVLLKRMEALQTISDFRPEERDTLIQLLLSYESHIGLQNAMNILLTEKSIPLFEQKENLPADFKKEMTAARIHQSSSVFPLSEAKRMIFQPALQKERMNTLSQKLS